MPTVPPVIVSSIIDKFLMGEDLSEFEQATLKTALGVVDVFDSGPFYYLITGDPSVTSIDGSAIVFSVYQPGVLLAEFLSNKAIPDCITAFQVDPSITWNLPIPRPASVNNKLESVILGPVDVQTGSTTFQINELLTLLVGNPVVAGYFNVDLPEWMEAPDSALVTALSDKGWIVSIGVVNGDYNELTVDTAFDYGLGTYVKVRINTTTEAFELWDDTNSVWVEGIAFEVMHDVSSGPMEISGINGSYTHFLIKGNGKYFTKLVEGH